MSYRAKITPQQVNVLNRRYGKRCAACGSKRKLQLDHIDPVAAAGEEHPRNFQWLCGYHNRKKGTALVDYRTGWRSWGVVRLARRLGMWMDTPMKPVLFAVGRTVFAVLLLLAIIFIVPVVLPVAFDLRPYIVEPLARVWGAVRMPLYLIGGALAMLLLGTWWEGRQWEAPDEYGQVRYRRSHLKKNPHIAEQRNAMHQETLLTKAKRHGPDKLSINYGNRPLEAPMLEETALPSLPKVVKLSDVRQSIPRGELALGMLGSGKLLHAPPSLCYHMLFHGETRSGKTNAINGLITQLHEQAAAGMPLRLYAGDRKGEFARTWQDSPLFPEGVATSAADIAIMLGEIVNDSQLGIDSRNRIFDQAARVDGKVKHVISNIDDYERVTRQPLERVFIIVDEINALMLEASKDNRLEASLMQLLQMGAGYGFYLLAGAQHLTAATLGTEGKYNFTTRAHFGDYNVSAINMLFGRVDAAALKPYMDGTKGRGVIKTVGSAAPVPFQSVYCEEQDILGALARAVRPHQAAHAAALENKPAQPILVAPVPVQHTMETRETGGDVGDISEDAYVLPIDVLLQRVSGVSGVSEEQKRDMITLAKAKVARRQISNQVLGGKGRAYPLTKDVLDTAGLFPKK